MKVFKFFINYIMYFALAILFIYWAITADSMGTSVVLSALAAFDIYLGLSNIFGKKDE
jgi:hypothetical protein